MQSALRNLLYDSGRFPLWFRILALVFGLGVLWLGVGLVVHELLGINLGMPFDDAKGSPWFGALACFFIACMWIFTWFAQLRLLFDAARRELVVWTRGCVHPHERRISLADAKAIHIHRVRTGMTGRTWRISLEHADGRNETVTDIPPVDIEAVAETLAAATQLPVHKHETDASGESPSSQP